MFPQFARVFRPIFIISWGAVCGIACEQPRGTYDFVDQPPPIPQPLPIESPEKNPASKTPVTPPSSSNANPCAWNTGRNSDGLCVPLHVRTLPHGQRIQIPKGRFIMGFVPQRYDANPSLQNPTIRWSGQPPHYAEVNSFFIDLYEVTHEAYQACVDAGKCTPSQCPPDHQDPFANLTPELANGLPQVCVTHAQALSYCTANGGRLPSEAEWEFAARGPDDRRYPWGVDINDSLPAHLYPAGQLADDRSYFGILGMGSNAYEWVADMYDAERALQPFLQSTFRETEAPLGRHRNQFESLLYCPGDPSCTVSQELSTRYVYKGWMIGARRAARKHLPKQVAESELEGWPLWTHSNQIGFRCAADLDPKQDEELSVPAAIAYIPLVHREADLLLFGGVAEAVTQQEAKQFCQQLTVPFAGEQNLTNWRLPNFAEIQQIAPAFRGPGPFWIADGAMAQTPAISEIWQLDAGFPTDAPLAARCIHDPS